MGEDKIKKSAEQWRDLLSPEAYHITREGGTERAFTGPYHDHKGAGRFVCICCDADLFDGADKFDSGTGWPSFIRPVNAEAVSEHADRKFFIKRTEVRCRRCEAHLGHVFDDGPEPTGLRYCINGHALRLDEEPDPSPATSGA